MKHWQHWLLASLTVATVVAAERHNSRLAQNDICKIFTPKTGERRVVFSHERHFAALGNKNCKACHDESKGLGSGNPFPSHAAAPATEPHGEKSLGRFCANCHHAPGLTAPLNPKETSPFTALGKPGDKSCSRCHVPADHGADFTRGHGDRAEHGAQRCAECHRGSTAVSPAELAQARAFRDAQTTLSKTPDNAEAFQKTLPNNFCAYCHGINLKAWGHEEEHEGRRPRRSHDD